MAEASARSKLPGSMCLISRDLISGCLISRGLIPSAQLNLLPWRMLPKFYKLVERLKVKEGISKFVELLYCSAVKQPSPLRLKPLLAWQFYTATGLLTVPFPAMQPRNPMQQINISCFGEKLGGALSRCKVIPRSVKVTQGRSTQA